MAAELAGGPDLDVAVAERVLGLDVVRYPSHVAPSPHVFYRVPVVEHRRPTGAYHDVPVPRYSTDMAAAWLVVEWMQAHGTSALLNWGEDDNVWECSWITGGDRYTGWAAGPALAVCRAVLLPQDSRER